MLEGTVDRIILTRPAVEAGENLGFLPGNLKEKIDPYLRPLYDALYEMLPADMVDKKLENGGGAVHGSYKRMVNGWSGRITYNENK